MGKVNDSFRRTNVKYLIFRIISSTLPISIISRLASYKPLNKIRSWLMGSENMPTLAEGEIAWEDIRFFFNAPNKVFYGAI